MATMKKLTRRQAVRVFGLVGSATLAGAASGAKITINGTTVVSGVASAAVTLSSSGSTTLTIVVTAADGSSTRSYGIVISRAPVSGVSCVLIPTETDGPYPLYSVLGNSSLYRADIREDRTGVPLTVRLSLVNVSQSCSPLANAVVYIWHCDKDGVYSSYRTGVGHTFLRGFQTSDAAGTVTFQTIYPGWYSGRIMHIHFEVFLQSAVSQGAQKATSQIAFPPAVTTAVYNSSLYTAHGQNTSVTSFAQDNVFSDGHRVPAGNADGRRLQWLPGDVDRRRRSWIIWCARSAIRPRARDRNNPSCRLL
jgi:hypothetical protein